MPANDGSTATAIGSKDRRRPAWEAGGLPTNASTAPAGGALVMVSADASMVVKRHTSRRSWAVADPERSTKDAVVSRATGSAQHHADPHDVVSSCAHAVAPVTCLSSAGAHRLYGTGSGGREYSLHIRAASSSPTVGPRPRSVSGSAARPLPRSEPHDETPRSGTGTENLQGAAGFVPPAAGARSSLGAGSAVGVVDHALSSGAAALLISSVRT